MHLPHINASFHSFHLENIQMFKRPYFKKCYRQTNDALGLQYNKEVFSFSGVIKKCPFCLYKKSLL